ncbi:MAG: acyl carrier protein [Christensenellaceae bacterium]|jgi:acyl carrier protein
MYERVKRLLQEYACIEPDQIRPESTLQQDLGLNSLDVVNVIVEFEEEFGIEVDEEDIRSFVRVQDIVDYLQQAKAPTGNVLTQS